MSVQFSPFRSRADRDDVTAAGRVAPPPPVETASSERLPMEQVRISMARAVFAWGFGAAFFNLA